MFTLALWWTTIALQVLVLARGYISQLVRRAPIFYCYLVYVLVESLSRFYVFRVHPHAYANFYWFTQFLSVAMGCAVVAEIYQLALIHSPGAKRVAQWLVFAVFLFIVFKVSVATLRQPLWSLARTSADLERNLRTVQAILIVVIISVALHYAIPLGRNLQGLAFGYSLFVGVSVLSLTLGTYFARFEGAAWRYIQPMTYLGSLLIWAASMWSYHPARETEAESRIEHDYEVVAARTKKLLAQLREQFVRAVRL